MKISLGLFYINYNFDSFHLNLTHWTFKDQAVDVCSCGEKNPVESTKPQLLVTLLSAKPVSWPPLWLLRGFKVVFEQVQIKGPQVRRRRRPSPLAPVRPSPWLTSARTSCLLLRSHGGSKPLTAQCFRRRLGDEPLAGRAARWYGLIDSPVFNSSHQRSINAKLQLLCSEGGKKSVNNLPVFTVNVLMCVLWSGMEGSCECRGNTHCCMFYNSFTEKTSLPITAQYILHVLNGVKHLKKKTHNGLNQPQHTTHLKSSVTRMALRVHSSIKAQQSHYEITFKFTRFRFLCIGTKLYTFIYINLIHINININIK